eukprot:1466647-Pleurochrysis_carterae.AAC.1
MIHQFIQQHDLVSEICRRYKMCDEYLCSVSPTGASQPPDIPLNKLTAGNLSCALCRRCCVFGLDQSPLALPLGAPQVTCGSAARARRDARSLLEACGAPLRREREHP